VVCSLFNQVKKFSINQETTSNMPRSGTLVICVQNLDFSGANQVVLNIVAGRMHESNVVVLSPKIGSFAARFVDSGAAVRVGDLDSLLTEIRDVFCILCNTIMTADIVVKMASRSHPVVWILHEWWDDEMIHDNFKLRNIKGLTLSTVKQALERASTVVFVCESQRELYKPIAPSAVIFVGVPDPAPRLNGYDGNGNGTGSPSDYLSAFQEKEAFGGHDLTIENRVFTFLCLGIICPRKNQLWTVELFKEFAKDKQNVRLVIVGARRTRLYEIEYLEKIQSAIAGDPRIELHDVTDNVDMFFAMADCLILTSLNEVTPMVISEAMSWYIPVLSTNIAGIKEMYTDGVEGFLFAPGDSDKALLSMEAVFF
jgi:glycosyltransferase involved in cell wall biosynthesis